MRKEIRVRSVKVGNRKFEFAYVDRGNYKMVGSLHYKRENGSWTGTKKAMFLKDEKDAENWIKEESKN